MYIKTKKLPKPKENIRERERERHNYRQSKHPGSGRHPIAAVGKGILWSCIYTLKSQSLNPYLEEKDSEKGEGYLCCIPLMKRSKNILKLLHLIIQNSRLIWKLNSDSSHFLLLCCKRRKDHIMSYFVENWVKICKTPCLF